MSHESTILLTGYMAGVVFGSIISVTIHRLMLKKTVATTGRRDPMREHIAR
jgi:hypothetical protein